MVCVIYCRVSTITQNTRGVSIDLQEKKCKDYAKTHNLKPHHVYKEVCSAYRHTPRLLKKCGDIELCHILVMSVDRFSRNVDYGSDLARKIIKNNGSITFIQENFVCKYIRHIPKLKKLIRIAENESKTLSIRITNAKKFLFDNGLYSGGTVSYGQKVVDRKIYMDLYEHNVIEFIKLCRGNLIEESDLNEKISKISKLNILEPIRCYDADDKNITTMTGPMPYGDICELLNSYDVTKRDTKWEAHQIGRILNTDRTAPIQKKTLKRQREEVDMELFQKFIEFNNMNRP